MLWSTSLATIPSREEHLSSSIANKAEIIAELTPVEAFKLQLGLAPSQIIPVTLPTIF